VGVLGEQDHKPTRRHRHEITLAFVEGDVLAVVVRFGQFEAVDVRPADPLDAGAVRFRPMMLTAAAVVVGASVILFDPIFQGLAISLMAGEIASLLLSRMAVPVIYFLAQRKTIGA
jgi:Cu/Ag efflux pump CusA